MKVVKKYKFQLNITKIMLARQKNTGTWVVNKAVTVPSSDDLSLTTAEYYAIIKTGSLL